MQAIRFKALAMTALCAVSFNALAELQTWHYTGTVDRQTEGFTAPSWLGHNQTVSIDYVIDMSVPVGGDAYSQAVKSISFNGQTYQTDGYVFSWENSLFGLNTSVEPAQADGINFVSFGTWQAPASGPDLATLLTSVSQTPFGPNDFLRLDFGNAASVYLRNQSFAAAVPEAGALPMALIGALTMVGVAAVRRQQKAK